MNALHETKHGAHSRDANKAQGKAECFISIVAAHQVFISRKAQARQYLNYFKEFLPQYKCICCFLVA